MRFLGTWLLRFSFYRRGSPGKRQSGEQIRAGESVLKMAPLASGDALGRRDIENPLFENSIEIVFRS